MNPRRLLLAIASAALLVVACGGDDDCEPGVTRTCECADGGDGEQVCADDGTFGDCERKALNGESKSCE